MILAIERFYSYRGECEVCNARDIVFNFIVGVREGVIAATFVCPLDVIKTSLQVHGLPKHGKSGSKEPMPYYGGFSLKHQGHILFKAWHFQSA